MGVLKRQTLTRSCDAARADLGELLDEEADDQLGLGGEGQFFLARWRRELQGTRKSATSVGGWSTGGARAHAHQRLHPLGSVLALLLLVHHGLVVQMCRMVRPCWYLASRDIVRPLPPARADDPHADPVVMGITFTCVLILFLIALMTTSCYFILKNTTIKKNVPVMSP